MGDGLIAEFGSVVDAVACAATVQKHVAAWQAEMPSERQIVLRIGINLGDVVVEGDDLLGDGVNVAARLEQICPPGGVLISGTAYDHLEGKLNCRFEYTGEQHLKNIARPVRTYRLSVAGTASGSVAAAPATDKPAVAVCPSRTSVAIQIRSISATASPRTSSPNCPAFVNSWSLPEIHRSRSVERTSTCAKSGALSGQAT